MSCLRTLAALAAAFALCFPSAAQDDGYEVFVPISKYLGSGDADRLSAWFADNLEVSILSSANDCSKSQARQIMRAFFQRHTPRSFDIRHKASKGGSKYAVGDLKAGGETYQVTIFVSNCREQYKIQQLKVDRFR